MKKILFNLIGIIVLSLAACSPAATPTNTTTPEVPATSTTVVATKTPILGTETPTVTASPIVPIPTNPPDCTNAAAFDADVTVPDYTSFNQGETFTKTWRIKNIGTCTWNPDYHIVFSYGEQMDAPFSTSLPVTAPDATAEISLELTAPTGNGEFTSNFELRGPSGETIPIDNGKYLWTTIRVGTVVSPTLVASNPGSGAGTGTGTGIGTSSSTGGAATTGSSGGTSGSCNYLTDDFKVTVAISAINTYRGQNNVPTYPVNPLLSKAAQQHAVDMACNLLFVHTGSDGSTPASRVAAVGYTASSVTENVYGSYPPLSGQDVVTWWATDQTDVRHNQNLLSTKYTEIGVGYAYYNNYGFYVVDFATP
jgi:uncharacterized protein YkwD